MNNARRCGGFTLPELLLLIVVFAIGLTGILLVFNNVVAGSSEPIIRKQAMAAAESMLEEILLMPFANPTGGWSGGAVQANRQNFDDVQDYAGFTMTGIFAIDGAAPISGLEPYTLGTAIANVGLGSVPAADSLRVTVTVTAPNTSFVLEGYKLKIEGP